MLTLSVTACDKKKTDTEPLPEEVTEETVESTESVYIEAADEDFDKIRPDLYDLLKSLHKTRHALEDLPQTSQ